MNQNNQDKTIQSEHLPSKKKINNNNNEVNSQDINQYFEYMGYALKLAQEAFTKAEVPVGAILVYQDQIIAQAHNQTEQKKSALAHAELLVLEEATQHYGRWKLIRDTTLFVTLEPCSMCAGALVLSRISKVVYALADAKSGACGSVTNIVQNSMLNHQLEVIAGIRQEESRELLRNFFQWRRQNHMKTTTKYYW